MRQKYNQRQRKTFDNDKEDHLSRKHTNLKCVCTK